MDRGVFVDRTEAERTTVAALFGRYKIEVLPTKKDVVRVESRLKLLTSHFGSLAVASLRPLHISQYRDARLKQVGPQTVKHELSILSRVINVAIKDWGIALPSGNPVMQVRMPLIPRGRERRLVAGERGRLFAAFSRNPMMRALFQFAVETAMRRSELARLRWEHIDLAGRVLQITESKNSEARRIPLSTAAIQILRSLSRRIDGFVFGVRANSITQAFERACARSAITGLRLHDLRHEATSQLFERGLNSMEVAHITGHKTLQMLKRYTHLRAEDLALKLA
jgi:integrase